MTEQAKTFIPEESAERPLSAQIAQAAQDDWSEGDNPPYGDWTEAKIVFQGKAVKNLHDNEPVDDEPLFVPASVMTSFLNGETDKAVDLLVPHPYMNGTLTRTQAYEKIKAAVDDLAPWERDLLLKERGKLRGGDDRPVYVAGPMRGKPEHNYPVFNAVTANLRHLGRNVLNPAENFGGDQTHELEEYMALDLQMVMDATGGIVLLPGWRDSELGRIEASMAKALGRQFYEARLKDGADEKLTEAWEVVETETPKTTGPKGIDGEARALVFGARNALYGPPVLDFTCVGRKWAATLTGHLQVHIDDIPATIVSVMLTDLKTARQARTPEHHDSRVDVIGYQLCLDRIVTDDGRKPDA